MNSSSPQDPPQKFGTLAISGLPNAGKSTLLNEMLGVKISAVTHKAQTTRFAIRGILTRANTQMLILDSPGMLQRRSTPLEKTMARAVRTAFSEADIVLHLVDCARVRKTPVAKWQLPKHNRLFIALNKIDLVPKPELLKIISALHEHLESPQPIFLISGKAGDGVPAMIETIAAEMPEGEWMFAADALTDQPSKVIAAEIVREQVFLHYHEEIPYGMTVQTESWQESSKGLLLSFQIIVPRAQQRGIIIGRGGQALKQVAQASRLSLQEFFGTPVHTKFFVKVVENWQSRQEYFDEFSGSGQSIS